MESVDVKVIFTGPAEQLVGCHQELIALPKGSTLRELLRLLSERHGSDFRDYVFVDGETLSDEILILIDGLNALGLGGLETPLVGDTDPEVEVGFLGPVSRRGIGKLHGSNSHLRGRARRQLVCQYL